MDAPSPQDVQLAAVAGLLAPLLLDVDGAAAALSDNPLLTGKTVRRRAAPMHSISQARLDPVSRGWNARRSPWCTRRSCSSSSSRRATPAGWACSGGERARSSPALAVPGRAAARPTLRCARRRAREIPAEVKTLKAQLPKPVEGQEVTSPLTGQIAALEQARRPPADCLCARRTPWVQACVPALRPPVCTCACGPNPEARRRAPGAQGPDEGQPAREAQQLGQPAAGPGRGHRCGGPRQHVPAHRCGGRRCAGFVPGPRSGPRASWGVLPQPRSRNMQCVFCLSHSTKTCAPQVWGSPCRRHRSRSGPGSRRAAVC